METRDCPECGGTMQIGFVPDSTYGAIRLSSWHPGLPEDQRLFGLNLNTGVRVDWSQAVPIEAHRCESCGLLRFYAPNPES